MTARDYWDATTLGESDINAFLRRTADAFTAFTPLLYQGPVAVSTDLAYGGYWRSGRLCVCNVIVRASSTGRSDQPIRLQLPFEIVASTDYIAGQVIGTGHVYDYSADAGNSGGYHAHVVLEERSYSFVEFRGGIDLTQGYALGLTGSATGSIALSAFDWVGYQVQYETGASA